MQPHIWFGRNSPIKEFIWCQIQILEEFSESKCGYRTHASKVYSAHIYFTTNLVDTVAVYKGQKIG